MSELINVVALPPSFPCAGKTVYSVYYSNGVLLGTLAPSVDGYYYYWPSNQGAWSAESMRAIADKLDEINAAEIMKAKL